MLVQKKTIQRKTEMVMKISEATGISKSTVSQVFDATLKSIFDILKEGGEIKIPGFGSFSTRRRSASIGRNPKTGEPINIAAAVLPVFKAGKTFKEAVNCEACVDANICAIKSKTKKKN